MPRYNGNGNIVLGQDHTDSSVDEFELQERHYPQVDEMARRDPFTRLNHINSLVMRAHRDNNHLYRIMKTYGLCPDGYARATDHIAQHTLEAIKVGFVA